MASKKSCIPTTCTVYFIVDCISMPLLFHRERLTNLLSDHSNIEQEHQALISTHNSYVHENELKVQHLQER